MLIQSSKNRLYAARPSKRPRPIGSTSQTKSGVCTPPIQASTPSSRSVRKPRRVNSVRSASPSGTVVLLGGRCLRRLLDPVDGMVDPAGEEALAYHRIEHAARGVVAGLALEEGAALRFGDHRPRVGLGVQALDQDLVAWCELCHLDG